MTGKSNRFATSTRRAELPSNWQSLRKITRRRAQGRCEWTTNGVRCTARGTDCDHIDDPDNHSPSNLQWLCHDHHEIKTKAEAKAARHPGSRKRPTKPHIGLIQK